MVGAGFAGLGAARTLADAGVETVVVDARDRLGGRAHTGHVAGRAIDLGAAWIHGLDGNPMTALASASGARLHRTHWHRPGDPATVVDPAGRRLDAAAFADGFGRFWTRLDEVYATGIEPDVSVTDALGPGRPLDPGSPGDAADGFRYAALVGLAEVEAADAEVLALGERVPDDRPGGDHLLLDGYSAVVAHLADGLDVRLEHPVEAIRPVSGGLEVLGGFGAIRASRVVLTAPVGVLRSGAIDLGGLLPDGIRHRLDRIGMGAAEKLVLAFDDPAWPLGTTNIAVVDTEPDDPFPAWIAHPNGPTLVSYAAGRRARSMAGRATDDLRSAAMATLRRALGDLDDPVDVVRTNWTTDPWSLGSYSYDGGPGAHRARREIADWRGDRLHLAGEAWWPEHHATTDGALSSGRAVANHILA